MSRKLRDLRTVLETTINEDPLNEAEAVAALFNQDNVAKKMYDVMADTKDALRRVDDIKKLITKLGGGKIDSGTMVGRTITALEKLIKSIQKEIKPFVAYY